MKWISTCKLSVGQSYRGDMLIINDVKYCCVKRKTVCR